MNLRVVTVFLWMLLFACNTEALQRHSVRSSKLKAKFHNSIQTLLAVSQRLAFLAALWYELYCPFLFRGEAQRQLLSHPCPSTLVRDIEYAYLFAYTFDEN